MNKYNDKQIILRIKECKLKYKKSKTYEKRQQTNKQNIWEKATNKQTKQRRNHDFSF